MILWLFMAALVVLLVLVEGFFSGSETVFTSVSRAYIHERAGQGDVRAVMVQRMLSHTERFLGTTLLGTNLAVVSSTTLCQVLIAGVLSHDAVRTRLQAWQLAPGDWSSLTTTLVMTPLILLLGELVPKSLGRSHADPMALALIRPLRAAGIVLSPLIFVTGRVAGSLARLFGGKQRSGFAPRITREDLRAFAELAAEQALVPAAAGEMLCTVFDLDSKPASSVMIPLVDVACVPCDATVGDVAERSAATGFVRFPVYKGRVDNIVGIVDLREMIYEGTCDLDASAAEITIAPFVHPNVVYIPESKAVGDLIHELRYQRVPMVVVVDEHGGVVGMLTTEDLVEEIVGEIQDERDRPGQRGTRISDAVYECDGKVEIRNLEEELGVEVESNGFDTAAGLVLKLAGRIPSVGDAFTYAGFDIEVLELDGRRISRLRFRRTERAPEKD